MQVLGNVTVRHPNVTISTQNSAYTWTFDGAGNLVLPLSGNIVGATANNIHSLPPELIRKGRLDEIFFVDLPDQAVRQDIFAIHLAKRELHPDGFDSHLLAQRSAGFSGAEIEQVVVSGLYRAHATDTPVSTESLLMEIANTRPLSVVMQEPIEALRDWAKDRTVQA